VEPDAVEIRVLGCLIEKQRTTPDQYPLTINALRLACNQATNRDPVVEYDEASVRGALERLGRRRWTRLASWSSSRAMKYRHLLGEELALSSADLALLAVLMLRGPQTPGELRQRSDRLHAFSSAEEIEGALEALLGRSLVGRLPRRPGQREQRYAQLLGGDRPEQLDQQGEPAGAALPARPTETDAHPPSPGGGGAPALEERVSELERELGELSEQVRRLRAELGA
jgi:hypothetical protein